MTTQHTPSFDQELARQLKATAAAQALADDYRRQLDKLRDELTTVLTAATGDTDGTRRLQWAAWKVGTVQEYAKRLETQLEEVSRQRDTALASLAALRTLARAVCASRVRCTDAVAVVGAVALGELERMVDDAK